MAERLGLSWHSFSNSFSTRFQLPCAALERISTTLPPRRRLVSETSVDAVTPLRKASSLSLARWAVRLSEDGCEEAFVAFLPIGHHDEILWLLEPLFGRLHELLDERLIPSSGNEANQKPAFGIDGGRFSEGLLLASRIPVTLVHLYRGGFDVAHPLVVKLS